jgi:hypothetical protein
MTEPCVSRSTKLRADGISMVFERDGVSVVYISHRLAGLMVLGISSRLAGERWSGHVVSAAVAATSF